MADPYRWLEDGDAAEVAAWTAAQSAHTRSVLDALAGRDELRASLEALLRIPLVVAPRLAGERVFALERGGAQDQAVLTVRPLGDPAASARVLVDPAAGSPDAAVAIDWYEQSPDGALVAYGTSEGGDERSTLRVLDLDTGEHLADEIPDTRAASVAWLPDASGFLYTRYPAGREFPREAYEHALGADPADDPLVWGEADLVDPTAWTDVRLSPDGRWLVVHASLGWSRVDVHLVDRRTGHRTPIVEAEEAVTSLSVVGDRLYGTTTLGAPRGRVVTATTADPGYEHWQTVVAEGDAVIDAALVAGGSLLVARTDVNVARLHRYDLDGAGGMEIALPDACSLAGLDADPERERAVLAVQTFTAPPGLWRWGTGGLEPLGPPAEERTGYAVDRLEYPSTDGAAVPLFLVRAAATTLGPGTPVVLTGYGGFAIAETPAWSPFAVALADAGGVLAVAGIRGGLEHGEAWHHAGMRQHKQQVFDDFAAAADLLVERGIERACLAIRGGSNGGLLVAATLAQRPDLCRAVHCAVPLTDMVRYPRFLLARLWVPEYGDPEVAEDFAWLHAYSPYHHLVDGTCYPAVLVTTGASDSRVDPAHARKFAARLQAASPCQDERPVLLRVEERAGHGQGKPVGMAASEAADVLAFLLNELGAV